MSEAKMEKDSVSNQKAFVHELQMERVNKIFDILREGKVPHLHDLALELNVSKSHLQHLFKQKVGLSLGHLLAAQRLDVAAHLLSSTRMRVKEIAFTVGYEHTSSFIRAFERRFSEPPRVYRHNYGRSKS